LNRFAISFPEIALHGVTCLALISCSTITQGQDALRSALEGSTAYRARTTGANLRDDKLSVGPVKLRATIEYAVEWNDNIRYAETATEDDFCHTVQADLQATVPVTKNSSLSFGIGIGYQVYARNSDLDRFMITPDSELAWDITAQDFVVTLYDRFSDSQDVITQGAISGTARFPRIENTIGAHVRWYPGQYVFGFGYNHYNFFADSATFDYLSRHAENFFASAGWRFAAATTVGAEASASLTDYDLALQSDNDSLSVGPFVEWQVTPWLAVNLRGGVVYYSFSSPAAGGDEKLTSYYANGEVRHKVTDHLTQGLSARRDVQQGLNLGSQAIEQLSTRYYVAWAFHRSASLSTEFWYEHSREPQFGVVEEFDRYGLNFGLSATPIKHFQVGLTYRYAFKDSNFNLRDYRQNVVGMNLGYAF
jgi:hypothetical protein